MTTIYLDTEFSELTDDATLLSVGAVTEDGSTFYVELPAPLPRCSTFVRKHVLPLMEGGTALCTRAEFPTKFADWLQQWPDPVLLVDSDWDILVLRRELEGRADDPPGTLTIAALEGAALQVQIDFVPSVPRSAVVRVADAQYEQRLLSPREHHALDDALVLRAGALAFRDGQ